MTNRKGELCVAAKLDLVTGTVQGHPDGFGFLVPDDGGADLFLAPEEMHKLLHGDRATARRIGTDRRGRPEGEIVDVLARANRTIVGRLYEERGIAFVVAENRRINQDLLVPPGERGNAKSGDVVVVEVVEQPVAAARGHRARRRGARELHRPRDGNRNRVAQARSAARILGCGPKAGRQAAEGCARRGAQGARRPHVATARHHRRRDGEGLRRRRVLRAQGQGLPAARRDRRCLALCSRQRRARPRRPRARDVGLFPAPRDPDAARGAVERALLAEAAGRPPVHGRAR